MGKEINILAPELGFGSFGIAKVQVEITENEETISSRLYYFNIAEFSSFCDTVNTEFGSIHFGQHYIGLSNGDYNVLRYNGSEVNSPYVIVSDLSEAIAQLAP
jgi:hypothetical protein